MYISLIGTFRVRKYISEGLSNLFPHHFQKHNTWVLRLMVHVHALKALWQLLLSIWPPLGIHAACLVPADTGMTIFPLESYQAFQRYCSHFNCELSFYFKINGAIKARGKSWDGEVTAVRNMKKSTSGNPFKHPTQNQGNVLHVEPPIGSPIHPARQQVFVASSLFSSCMQCSAQ